MPRFNTDQYDQRFINNLARSMARIRNFYYQAIDEVAPFASRSLLKPTPFSLTKYPSLENKVDKTIQDLHAKVYAGVTTSIKLAWGTANDKNDSLVDLAVADADFPNQDVYYDPHLKAMEAFMARIEKGMNLSNRVWNLLDPFKHQLEQGLGIGLSQGKSAHRLAQDLKQYLNQPDKLFRRVRGEDGRLYLSQAARNYHPGPGVYRSSYKNAMRLTRTETNMAYRTADFTRWQTIDFVIGFEIRLSLSHPKFDICDHLVGRYPKEFLWKGWHPHCLCNMVPILANDKDFAQSQQALLRGEPDPTKFKQLTYLPQNFKDWYRDNQTKIEGWSTKPYWYRDNQALIEGINEISPIDEIMTRAKEAGPYVDGIATSVAVKYGGTVTPINYKSQDSIERKVFGEYSGDFSRLKDSVRTTIVVPEDQVDNVLREFEKDPNNKIKRQGRDKPDPMGYTGNIVNFVAPNGLVAEIQVNSPNIIFGKEEEKNARMILGNVLYDQIKEVSNIPGGLGHAFYEKHRVLNLSTEIDTAVELEKASTAYYNSLRQPFPSLSKSIKVNLKLLGLVKQSPRMEGETDKAYAKRVIDHLPEPGELFEKASMYFNVDKGTMVKLGDLKPIKAAEETVQSGANAINRMWGASQGILSKRDPISVGKLGDKYIVLDGNSTYTGAKNMGWKELPVKVLTKEEIRELAKDDDKIKKLFFPEKKPATKKPKEIKLADTKFTQEAIDKVLKAKSVGYSIWSIEQIDIDISVQRSLKNWFSSSNAIRQLSDLFPEKRWWLKAVTSETKHKELYRGERFMESQLGDEFVRQKDVFDYYINTKYKKGAIIDFSNQEKITVQNQKENTPIEVTLDNRLLSYTFNKNIADVFANKSSLNVYSVITTVRGKSGKPVRGFDVSQIGYTGEDEVVLGDSYKYEVIEVEYDKNLKVLYVTLEQIVD